VLFLCIYDPVYTCLPHMGPVARCVEKRNTYMMLVGNPKERDDLEGLGLNGG